MVFETQANDGQLLLAYLSDEQPDATWYAMAATKPATLEDLEQGRISVREALTSSWMWLVRTDPHDRVTGAWNVREDDIPEQHLPRPGTPLLPEHQPLLVTRALGDRIRPGQLPGSVVSFVSEGSRRAVKILLDFASDVAVASGRPRDEQRALYDLPIRQIRLESFAIAFAAPDAGRFDPEIVRSVGERLDKIARWAEGRGASTEPWQDEAERMAMLRAMECLTPPRSGPIETIELDGQWLRHERVRLDRSSRKKVRMQLRDSTTEQIVTLTGRIGELDRDHLTFILRDVVGRPPTTGTFREELLDDVLQYFGDDQRVTVAGKETSGKLHVTAIAPAPA